MATPTSSAGVGGGSSRPPSSQVAGSVGSGGGSSSTAAQERSLPSVPSEVGSGSMGGSSRGAYASSESSELLGSRWAHALERAALRREAHLAAPPPADRFTAPAASSQLHAGGGGAGRQGPPERGGSVEVTCTREAQPGRPALLELTGAADKLAAQAASHLASVVGEGGVWQATKLFAAAPPHAMMDPRPRYVEVTVTGCAEEGPGSVLLAVGRPAPILPPGPGACGAPFVGVVGSVGERGRLLQCGAAAVACSGSRPLRLEFTYLPSVPKC
jgi:hypothetical protein